MPLDLPANFADDLNHLGSLIRFFEGTRKEDSRREYLRMGMATGCSLLTELSRIRNTLASEFDELESTVADASKFVTENQRLFLNLEKLILMDFKIDNITRGIMLNNLKRVAAYKTTDGGAFSGSDVVSALDNLKTELCERSDEFNHNSKGMAKVLERTLTYAVAPINIAVYVFYPVIHPLVFKGSGWAATMASKLTPWQ